MSNGHYAGVLPVGDPLHGFLAREVLGRVLGLPGPPPVFDVHQLDAGAVTFLYSERRTGARVVGKFYGNKWLYGSRDGHAELRASLMRREFDNLRRARALGLDAPPRRVVRPLAASEALNCLLVQEFAPGRDLLFDIERGIRYGEGDRLRGRLTDVAGFLADLHNRSATEEPVSGVEALAYLAKLARELADAGLISAERRARLERLRQGWAASGRLEGAHRVLIHGDATPPHFVFGEAGLAVIDLERLWPGDRAADLGCLVAELKHLFGRDGRDPWASEPYIRHLYAAYLEAAPEDAAALTERGRFYQGVYELRISRNAWLEPEQRRRLLDDAEACLRL